ncbi:YegP family protein [Hymenobacter sp. BT491]|uniref:YegP family protein n=1 Tax=Hymenobacter sp. BT491 TaxID=2766779 RepID=UPI001653C235|nr:YegP family protein [Hymenobacter sp. BT491]MBC6991367.1 YegP family protein [Hymenobacter sp. BT491]
MGYFEIYQGKNGDHYFRLKAGNHEPILHSEGYSSRAACENGIESVKKNSPNNDRYVRREAPSFSFSLKATNGQVIGQSETYNSAAARENGIESVKRNAPEAVVKDLTVA